MSRTPVGLLMGLAAMAGVSLGWPGFALSILIVLGFLLLDMRECVMWRHLIGAVGLVAGMALFGAARGQPAIPPVDARVLEATSVIGVVRSMPEAGARFDSALFEITSVAMADGSRVDMEVAVIASFPVSLRANVGDRLELGGEFTGLPSLDPGYRRYVEGRQAVGVFRGYGATVLEPGSSPLRPLVDLRRDLTRRLQRALPGDVGALAAGIVTGDDSGLSDESDAAFQASGLSHVTAVSGQNIAILAGLVTLIFRGQAIRRLLAAQVLMLVVVWLYVGVTGFGPPAIRAGLFVTFAFAAGRLGRRPDFLTILALVSGGMLLVNPAYVSSVSFWLSMAASAALVTAIGWPTGGARAWGIRTVAALAAAQLATVPIAIAVFGTWSLGSIPANLIVGPLMELAFPLCFLLAGCLYLLPFLAPLIASIAELPLLISIETAKSVSAILPRTQLAAGGIAVVLAAAIPCAAMIALLSDDARRWWTRLEVDGTKDEASLGAAAAGVVIGCALAILAVRFLVH